MRLRPLPRAVIAFAFGLVTAFRAPIPELPSLVPLSAAAALFFILPRYRSAILMAGFVIVGIVHGQHAARAATNDCRARLADGARLEVVGSIASQPVNGRLELRLEGLRGRRGVEECAGSVNARLRGGAGGEIRPGTEIVAWGQWLAHPPDGPWPRPAIRAGSMQIDSIRVVSPPAPARDPLLALRGAAQARIRALLPRSAGLAEAMILARREGLDPELRDRFARSGLAHLLAISGLHVGLIAGGLLLLGRVLRMAPRRSAALSATATAAYVLFLGAPHAAARAAIQVILVLATRLWQRPSDPFSLLATAALTLLAVDPLAILDPGFQLSFAGTGGLIALRRRLLDLLPRIGGKAVRDSVATSIAATLATAPITVIHFGQIAPIGILANLPAIPIVGLAVPALAFSLATSLVSMRLARFLAGGADLLLQLIDIVARVAADLPGAHVLVPRDAVIAWTLATILAAVTTGWLARHAAPAGHGPFGLGGAMTQGPTARPRRGVRPAIRRLSATATALALLIAWPALAARLHDDTLRIYAIDVGQGDAFAIRTPAGRWILVDAGPKSDRYDAGRARVVPFLLRHGARRLDALILTHPDSDHIGGAGAILDAFDVGAIIDPGAVTGKPLYVDLLRKAERSGTRWLTARAGREVRIDDVLIEWLHPSDGPLDGTVAANEVTVAFRLVYGRFRALFLGDAPAAVEEVLVAKNGEALRAEVLKVAHHGSATSTSETLLETVEPRFAVIPVGRWNRFGHPAPEVIERLERYETRILRTDLNGTISFRVRPDGEVDVTTQR